MADLGKSTLSPISPHKSPRPRRLHGSPRVPHHSRRRKPRLRLVLDNNNAPPERLRSPLSPLSPPIDSRSASPESPSTPRAVDWPLRFLRYSGRVYPHPPSPVSASRSAATESPASPRKKTPVSSFTYFTILALALVFLALIGTIFYVVWPRSRRPHALSTVVCTTRSCLNYTKLLRDAMDEDQSPCDNFYKYVCGSWLDTRDPGDTVLRLAWRTFTFTVASTFESIYLPKERDVSIQKAATYWQACLSVLNHSNVPGVKRVLEKAGITWPQPNPKPDFLNAMFFMTHHVNMPVFVELTTVKFNSMAYRLHFSRWPIFGDRMRALATLSRTRQLADHLAVLYKSFGGTDNSRLRELTQQFEGMEQFFARYSNASIKTTIYSNAMSFLQFTPTVSVEKWNALYKRYQGVTVTDAKAVSITDVEYFAAVFELHKKYGDAVMNDIVEGLAVENLIGMTEKSILESFYGNADEVVKAVQKHCFHVSYSVFNYAINYFFLRSKSVPYDEAKKLAEDVREKLPKLLNGNSSLLATTDYERYLKEVFRFIERSLPGEYLSAYTNYPNMTTDPLRNWMLLVSHRTKGSALEDFRFIHTEDDRNNCRGFRITMPELMSPLFASDAHWAIRYGGLGAHIAAALFCAYIEGSKKSEEIYRANQDCLYGKSVGQIDKNLQAVVASAGVISRLFEQARSEQPDSEPLIMDVPPFKSEQLLFVFRCHLLCGEARGEEQCNTPMQHSSDFARAFACPQDSHMNPTKKCWMLPA